MIITCKCETREEYNDLIQQLREENIKFTAPGQKEITEWWNDEDKEEHGPHHWWNFIVTFCYSGKLI